MSDGGAPHVDDRVLLTFAVMARTRARLCVCYRRLCYHSNLVYVIPGNQSLPFLVTFFLSGCMFSLIRFQQVALPAPFLNLDVYCPLSVAGLVSNLESSGLLLCVCLGGDRAGEGIPGSEPGHPGEIECMGYVCKKLCKHIGGAAAAPICAPPPGQALREQEIGQVIGCSHGRRGSSWPASKLGSWPSRRTCTELPAGYAQLRAPFLPPFLLVRDGARLVLSSLASIFKQVTYKVCCSSR